MTPTLLPLDGPFDHVTVIGRARHGKDTVANMLRVLDPSFHRVAYADTLKNHLAHLLSYSAKQLGLASSGTRTMTPEYFLSEFQNNKDKYRTLLQWFGTDFVRSFDDKYWIKNLGTSTAPRDSRFVLTDARFSNEIDSRIINGDFIIKVERDGTTITNSNHASESGIDSLPYHILIKNDGGLEDLFAQVKEVYDGYLANNPSYAKVG